MITKYIRKRNVDANLSFLKNFSRVQVHANRDQTFKFTKRANAAPPVTTGRLLTEQSFYLNSELGQRINIG